MLVQSDEASTSASGAARRKGGPWTGLLALAALALPLFFLGLGHAGLSEPDEPYYAVPAMEMLRSGTWAFTTLGGQPWFDKPILFYWTVAASFRLFGVSEAAARLGSALAGLGGVLAVYGIGRKGSLGERGALLAAVALGSMLEYALLARAAITDAMLTLFLTLGMLLVERALATGRAWLYGLAGASFGLAVLTKGPVGVVLPGLAIALYAIAARRADPFRPRALVFAAAGGLLAAGPWFLYMAIAHPDLLFKTFIGQGNLGRFLTPEHPSFPLFYVAVLAVGTLPWTGAVALALGRAAKPRAWAEERGSGRVPGPLFLLAWFAAVVGFFSLTASKLLTYVLPSLPPLAMLAGGFWTDALGDEAGRRPKRRAFVAVVVGGILSVVLGIGLVIATRGGRFAEARHVAVALAAALVAGTVPAYLAVRRRSAVALAVAHAATAAVCVLLFVFGVFPHVERQDSERPLVRELERQGAASRVAGIYDVSNRFGVDFYLRRSLPRLEDAREFARRAAADPGAIWIVPVNVVSELPSRAGLSADVVARSVHLAAVRVSPVPGGPVSR